MDGRAAMAADPEAEPAPPDDAEPVELAPEHLRLLQQLAASRAASRAMRPGSNLCRPSRRLSRCFAISASTGSSAMLTNSRPSSRRTA